MGFVCGRYVDPHLVDFLYKVHSWYSTHKVYSPLMYKIPINYQMYEKKQLDPMVLCEKNNIFEVSIKSFGPNQLTGIVNT